MFSFWPPFLLLSTPHVNLLFQVQQGTCFETGTLLQQWPTRAAAALPVIRDPSSGSDCTRAPCTSFLQGWGEQDHHPSTTASSSNPPLQQSQWFRSLQAFECSQHHSQQPATECCYFSFSFPQPVSIYLAGRNKSSSPDVSTRAQNAQHSNKWDTLQGDLWSSALGVE